MEGIGWELDRKKINDLWFDNGIEYTDKKFMLFCEENEIQSHFSVRKTPQHNGVA